jgi:hypothetical protein
LPGQGVCDLCQARGVRDMSKAIALFCKADSGLGALGMLPTHDRSGSPERGTEDAR